MQSTQPRSSHLAQIFWPLHPQSVVLVPCWPWPRRVPPVGRFDSQRCRCRRGWRGCDRPWSPRGGCNRWPSRAGASARDGSHQSKGTLNEAPRARFWCFFCGGRVFWEWKNDKWMTRPAWFLWWSSLIHVVQSQGCQCTSSDQVKHQAWHDRMNQTALQ